MDDIYVECDQCGIRYTISSEYIHLSDIEEDDSNDVYPQYCSFCGKEIEI